MKIHVDEYQKRFEARVREKCGHYLAEYEVTSYFELGGLEIDDDGYIDLSLPQHLCPEDAADATIPYIEEEFGATGTDK